MPRLYLKFSVSRHRGFPPPSVVASVDLNRDHRPDDGEFFLLSNDKLVWQGQISFDEPKEIDGLTVSLVYAVNVDERIDVEVRADGPEGKIYNKTSLNVERTPEQLFLKLKEPAK